MENRAYEDEANKAAHHLHQQYQQQQHQHQLHQFHHPQGGQVYPGQFVLPQNHQHFLHQQQQPQPQPQQPQQQLVPATMFDSYRNSVVPHHGPECHVYEDIAYSLEPSQGGGFQRNLTLPLRRTSQSCESLEGVSSSVRVTSRERRDRASVIDRLTERSRESSMENSVVSSCGSVERPSRRRRKKDCRRCRSNHPQELVHQQQHRCQEEQLAVYEERNAELRAIFGLPSNVPGLCHLAPVVYAIGCNSSECSSGLTPATGVGAPSTADPRFAHVEAGDKGLITPAHPGVLQQQQRNRAGMKVNSIYAQEHWHAKDPRTIFLNDHHPGKEQDLGSPFQRGYSGANSPSSDNRTNLRRSAREESAGEHPARLRKHRHGFSLHFGRPLGALGPGTLGCTKSLVLLLIVVLTLLGIGGLALYIVFEPEKLHVIQQYLRSSKNATSLSSETELVSSQDFGEPVSPTTTFLPPTTTLGSLLVPSLSFEGNEVPSGKQPVYEIATRRPSPSTTRGRLSTLLASTTTTTRRPTTTTTTTSTTTTTTTTSRSTSVGFPFESTRLRGCAECFGDEVCVARNADEPAHCQTPNDRTDPNGCGGLCDYNVQSCHKEETGDSYRCIESEHHCLEDEWTCRTIFCIPLVKRCDGQMNCYDHSDEYNCECDLSTHFHCGNQTSCLPLAKKCDGHVDCFDATDEENCTTSHEFGKQCPSPNEQTCANKQQCFLKTRFCDGYKDCADGSDEPVGCQLGRCNKLEFGCGNGRCIDKSLKCNGVDDCGDGSDEKPCRERM